MIKAVLFDFGGVLTEGGKVGSIRAMFARAYGVEPEKVRLSDAVERAFCGLITDEQLVSEINALNPAFPPATTDIFTKDADVDFFVRSEPVYAMAGRLREQGILTGIFSNVFHSSAELLQERGFYDGFERLFLSYEMHKQKPDSTLYQDVLTVLKLTPQEVLFIDDKDECLAPARAVGMHTVLAVSPVQIVRDTEALAYTGRSAAA